MITLLVGFIVAVVAILVMGLYGQMRAGMQQVQYIRDDTQHLYFSEQVFASLTNRLKQAGWHARFYYDVNRTPSSATGSGMLGNGAEYEWFVQDVVDDEGDVRRDLTDVFVKVTYKEAVQSFMERIQFRLPTKLRPTSAAVKRFARIGRQRELTDASVRQEILAELELDSAAHLENRAAARVLGRELRQLARTGTPAAEAVERLLLAVPGRSSYRREDLARNQNGSGPASATAWLLWLLRSTASPVLAGIGTDEALERGNRSYHRVRGAKMREDAAADLIPAEVIDPGVTAGLAGEIGREQEILDLWVEADLALRRDPPDLAAARASLEQARDRSEARLPLHRGRTLARSLFRRARVLTLQADWQFGDTPAPAEPSPEGMRALTCDDSTAPPPGSTPTGRARLAHLAEAALDYKRISEEFPDTRDAPHAYVPWGWLAVKAVLDPGIDPADPAASRQVRASVWNAARQCAYQRWEELRSQDRYRQYHLWGEDAVTTRLPPGVVAGGHDQDNDEIVFYERELLVPRLASVLILDDGGWSLVVSDANGANPVPVFTEEDVTGLSGIPTYVRWTPSSDALLYIAGSMAGGREIFEYEMVSKKIRQLTHSDAREEQFELVFGGEEIVAVSSAGGGKFDLALLTREGQFIREVVTGVEDYPYVYAKGNKVFYKEGGGLNPYRWYQLDLLTDERSLVSVPGDGDTIFLALSPDGGFLACSLHRGGAYFVVVLDSETGEEKMSFDVMYPAGWIEWSDDGTSLRWLVSPWGIGYSVTSLNVESGETQTVIGSTKTHGDRAITFAFSPIPK